MIKRDMHEWQGCWDGLTLRVHLLCSDRQVSWWQTFLRSLEPSPTRVPQCVEYRLNLCFLEKTRKKHLGGVQWVKYRGNIDWIITDTLHKQLLYCTNMSRNTCVVNQRRQVKFCAFGFYPAHCQRLHSCYTFTPVRRSPLHYGGAAWSQQLKRVGEDVFVDLKSEPRPLTLRRAVLTLVSSIIQNRLFHLIAALFGLEIHQTTVVTVHVFVRLNPTGWGDHHRDWKAIEADCVWKWAFSKQKQGHQRNGSLTGPVGSSSLIITVFSMSGRTFQIPWGSPEGHISIFHLW